MGVLLQVLGQVVDASSQQSNLNLGRTSIGLVNASGLNDVHFGFHFEIPRFVYLPITRCGVIEAL
jgi:hypothetical protein